MESVVAKVNELSDGQMKEVTVGNITVLIINVKGKYYALGGKCSHVGAPLADGLLHEHVIRCPWHQACFDILTGECTEPPALDDLPVFKVTIKDDDVVVEVPDEASQQVIPKLVKFNKDNKQTFVILGSGAAGSSAAESLRHNGYQGRIMIITKEKLIPYDRTILSKGYLKTDGAPIRYIRNKEFYDEYGIEIMTGHEVTTVEQKEKAIVFSDGSSVNYDKLLISVGSVPRRLDVPGHELSNIFTLRSPIDADKIRSLAYKGSKAVIIGAGFIGLESCGNLTDRGVQVTVVSIESAPFENLLGKEIGNMFRRIHEERGVNFKLGCSVNAFEGDERVRQVVLSDGETLEADFVLLGIGVEPASKFIKGIDLNADGSITVNKFLQISDDVYAAGDIASFQWWYSGEQVRIEHWRTALQHGRIAGSNMAGNTNEYKSIPFFWSNQPGVNLRYIGYTNSWDEIILQGSIEKKDFIAFYVKNDKILAVAGVGNTMQMLACAQLMQEDAMLTPEQLRGERVDMTKLLKG